MIVQNEIQVNKNPFWRFMNRLEDGAGFVMLLLLALIPFVDAVLRTFFHSGIPYGQNFLDALIIPITFLGVALASRSDRHLSINLGLRDRADIWGTLARSLVYFTSGIVVGLFFISSLEFVINGFAQDETILFIPVSIFLAAFPVGLFIVVWRTYPKNAALGIRILYLVGLAISVVMGMSSIVPLLENNLGISGAVFGMEFLDGSWWHGMMQTLQLPLLILLVLSAIAGTPLFLVLGGMALFLFAGEGQSAFFAFSDGYAQLKNSTTPAIALFTFAGYILSESDACKRLIKLFQSLLGRLPGGIIIVVVIISAFFTSFTGASGITIVALGAMLIAILNGSGKNSESLSIGLVTGSGAIGLMFPPSLAIIIYGAIQMSSVSTAGGTPANILEIFLASLIPGFLFIIAMIGLGIFLSWREHKGMKFEKPPKVSGKEKLLNLKDSALELLMPVLVIVVYFTGVAGIVEAAAFAALYALIVEVFIKKEISFKKLISITVNTLVIFGGILAILTFARGLSSYFVYSQMDIALIDWAQETIKSPILFLFLMNILLLIVGCFMDIFSAITIFVPLLSGVATAFGIHQAHLAVIFLANLSVGFITPPVGMDLFLASYRFDRPMVKIYKDVWPFVLVQLIVVLLITYVPWFSMAILGGTSLY